MVPRFFVKKRHISAGSVIYRMRKQKLEVLLLWRRATKSWHLPKGTRTGGESLRETTVREVYEETGYTIKLAVYLGKLTSTYYRQDRWVPKLTHYFLASPYRRTGRPDKEHDKTLWVPIEKAFSLLNQTRRMLPYFEDETTILAVARRKLLVVILKKQWCKALQKLTGSMSKHSVSFRSLAYKLQRTSFANTPTQIPRFIVISGPSGVGKSTVIHTLRQRGIAFLPNVTTRPPRQGEENGKDYFFLSRRQFFEERRQGRFFFWNITDGSYRGFSKVHFARMLKSQKPFLIEKSVRSLQKMIRIRSLRVIPHVKVFLLPPTFEELVERLEKRSSKEVDPSGELLKKLKEAADEFEESSRLGYRYVVNESIHETSRTIAGLLTRR